MSTEDPTPPDRKSDASNAAWADLTAALRRLNDPGGGAERDRVTELVYGRLKEMAQGLLAKSRRPGGVEATQIVHQLYLRLSEAKRLELVDRSHFFAIASTAMQQIIVDEYRRRMRLKRGGGADGELQEATIVVPSLNADILDLDAALRELESADERAAVIVRLRFFSGLSMDEIAEVLGVSPPTVDREWRSARAWLGRRLGER